MERFNEHLFRERVNKALGQVRRLLSTERNPTFLEDVPHQYDDKFGVAEFLTNVALAAEFNCLEAMGLDAPKLVQLHAWAKEGKTVTLRVEVQETVTHSHTSEVKIESPSVQTTKKESNSNPATWFSTTESKLVTTVTEHHWKVSLHYDVFAFRGASPDDESDVLKIGGRTGQTDVVTRSKQAPGPSGAAESVDLDLTWALSFINPVQGSGSYTLKKLEIDRTVDSCRTPRRNKDIDTAVDNLCNMCNWARRVHKLYISLVQWIPLTGARGNTPLPSPEVEALRGHLQEINTQDLFVPVLPLLEEPSTSPLSLPEAGGGQDDVTTQMADDTSEPLSVLMSTQDMIKFLEDQRRALTTKVQALASQLPKDDSLLTPPEGALLVGCLHMIDIAKQHSDGVMYIEHVLYRQLTAAVGREVTAEDFQQYMERHDQKLYKAHCAPKPFCHAVRRPGYYPEGTVAIEAITSSGDLPSPIQTFQRNLSRPLPPGADTRSSEGSRSSGSIDMKFRLNASTNVEFRGDAFLHAYVGQKFADSKHLDVNLVARSRQFSSFMIVIGKMASSTTFEPSHAMIVKNKDCFKIPLMLEQLPSAKAFRDAIESLSPEQQRFAKAYRAMQLEGSVFGVLVVQLKPQLERLLRLNEDSLTKEIKLTQQLLDLFIEYQIPSDLLSYSGDPAASSEQKLEAVKGHVAAIYEMIGDAKKAEVEEARQTAEYTRKQNVIDDDSDCDDEEDCDGQDSWADNTVASFGAQQESSFAKLKKKTKSVSRSMLKSTRKAVPMSASMAMPMAMPPPMPKMMNAAAPMMQESSRAAEAMMMEMDVGGAAIEKYSAEVALETRGVSGDSVAESQNVDGGVEFKDDDGFDFEGDVEVEMSAGGQGRGPVVDVTAIPAMLDQKLEANDPDGALRATVVKVGETVEYSSQKALLAQAKTETLFTDDLKRHKDKAFDLLDALSRSGSLTIEDTCLHVMVAATHCFDRSVMDTVIKENVNPIEKVVRSSLIVASTIQDRNLDQLVNARELPRVKEFSIPQGLLKDS